MSKSFRHTARLFDAAFQANLQRVFRSLRAARDSQRAMLELAADADQGELVTTMRQAAAMQSLEQVEAGLADASRDLHGILVALGTTRNILLDDGGEDPVQDEEDRAAMEAACQLEPPAVRAMRAACRTSVPDSAAAGAGSSSEAGQLEPPAVRRMRIRQAEDDGDGVGMGF